MKIIKNAVESTKIPNQSEIDESQLILDNFLEIISSESLSTEKINELINELKIVISKMQELLNDDVELSDNSSFKKELTDTTFAEKNDFPVISELVNITDANRALLDKYEEYIKLSLNKKINEIAILDHSYALTNTNKLYDTREKVLLAISSEHSYASLEEKNQRLGCDNQVPINKKPISSEVESQSENDSKTNKRKFEKDLPNRYKKRITSPKKEENIEERCASSYLSENSAGQLEVSKIVTSITR